MSKESKTLLVDYLHGALDATERAAFEDRLRSDASLRAQLTALRQVQQRVQGIISAEINTQRPPARMNFAAISAELLANPPRPPLRRRLLSSLTAIAALFILIFAVIYSLPDQTAVPLEGSSATAIPQFEALPQITVTATNPLSITLPPGKSSLPTRKSSIPERNTSSSIPTPVPTTTPEANNWAIPEPNGQI